MNATATAGPALGNAVAALRYSGISAVIFLLWDVCITIDGEVEFLRTSSSRAWLAAIYLFNRYFALAAQISLLWPRFVLTNPHAQFSPSVCHSWLVWTEIGVPLIISSVQLVFIVRVRALYHTSRWIPRLLSVSYCAELIGLVSTSVYLIPRQNAGPNCFPSDAIARVLYSVQIMPCFLLDTLLFALTLYRVLSDRRQANKTPLLRLVLRDGAWAYLLIFAILLVNTLTIHTQHGPLAWVTVDWTMPLASIVSSRLILNMEQLGRMHVVPLDVLSSCVELSQVPSRASDPECWDESSFRKYDKCATSSLSSTHMT